MSAPDCWRCGSATALRGEVFCAECLDTVQAALRARMDNESRDRLERRGHQITGGNES